MKPLAALLLVAALAAAVPADATIRLEAESLADAHNVGGAPIALVSCGTASNGHAIDGIDMPGEWIELNLLLTGPSCLYSAVRSAGLSGVVRNFRVEITPDPPTTTGGTDSLTTIPGTGIG